jgi:CheY-like chemotaxis protein
MSKGSYILLIDDDPDLRQCLVDVLEDEGYEIRTAWSGREALSLLETEAQSPPSLILLDLMMPDLNGWQFHEQQQKNPRLAAIPVLVVTASRGFGTKLPGSDVLLKPFSVESVLEKVKELAPGADGGGGAPARPPAN